MKIDLTKLKLNFKKRFTNKTFCISFMSAITLLVQQLGLDKYLPNLMEVGNIILTLLVMLGIVIDPTTNGIGDSKAILENKTSDDLRKELDELKEKIEMGKEEKIEEKIEEKKEEKIEE